MVSLSLTIMVACVFLSQNGNQNRDAFLAIMALNSLNPGIGCMFGNDHYQIFLLRK